MTVAFIHFFVPAMVQTQLQDCNALPAHDQSDCNEVHRQIGGTTLKRVKETTRWMLDNSQQHRLGQIHSVESQRDDRDMVCLDSHMEYQRRRQQHLRERVDFMKNLKAAWKEGAYNEWGHDWYKADKVISTRVNAPNGRRRHNMHEWGPWRCYGCKFQVKDSNKVTNVDEKVVWGVCTIDGNYDCDPRHLCCNNHAVRSFFNKAIDDVKEPLRGKFQVARRKALVLLGDSVPCPAGYSQQGYLGADIDGCGLEDCKQRANVNTIAECKDRCNARSDCLSFNYAPPNAKDHAKVCTLYNQAQPTGTWKDELIFCAKSSFPTQYRLQVSGAYCQKRWWLGNPAHGISNLDACAVAAAKNQNCHGKYSQFHDYGDGSGGGNCQCARDLCPEVGTTGQAASNAVYKLLKPMGFHGLGHCNEGHAYASKAWELASSTVGEQGFDTETFRLWKEKAWTLCREKNAATKFISVWKNAGYRCYTSSACTASGHADVQTWRLV